MFRAEGFGFRIEVSGEGFSLMINARSSWRYLRLVGWVG